MIKLISSAFLSCLFISAAMAQPVIKKLAFRSVFQAGILEGQSDKTAAQIQSVNGLQINTWFAGIGVGIDYYGAKRSVPLFAAIQKDLWKNKKTPFGYVNAGYNFSWLRDKEKSTNIATDYKQGGGLFYELGVGYKFVLKNKMYLGFAAGYSVKQQQEKGVSPQYCDFCVPQPIPPAQEYDYRFSRVSIRMNCWF